MKNEKILFFFLLFCVIFLPFSCSTTKKTAAVLTSEKAELKNPKKGTTAELLDRIGVLVKKGETGEALKIYEDYFNGFPKKPEDLSFYSSLLITNGDYDKAEEALNLSLLKDPDNIQTQYNLAILYGINGDTGAQEKILNTILTEDPSFNEASTSLGQLYLDRKKYSAAKALFNKSLEINNNDTLALQGLGNILLHDKKYKEAHAILSRLLVIDPLNMTAYIDRSRASIGSDDFASAEKDLSKAINIDPWYYWNYLDRGRVRIRLGRLNDAKTDLEKAVEIDPDNFFPYAYLAGINDDLGLSDEALLDYTRVVTEKEDYYFAYAPIAVLLYKKGDYRQAAVYFKKAFQYQPRESGYLLMAALSLIKDQKNREASSYLKENGTAVTQQNPFYHIKRLFQETGYDNYAIHAIEQEKDAVIKARLLFYLASFYDTQGNKSLSLKYFLKVEGPPDLMEYRLAKWELEKD